MIFMSSCGRTTGLKVYDQNYNGKRYSKVNVVDLVISPETQNIKNQRRAHNAANAFSEIIAYELRNSGKFKEVKRNSSTDADTLTIGGFINKYEDGSKYLRLLVGVFGIGASRFDAKIYCYEGESKRKIATIDIDRNSWYLGGPISFFQEPDDFVVGSAQKVAIEAAGLGSYNAPPARVTGAALDIQPPAGAEPNAPPASRP